jgi:hypothetical protein
MVLRIFYTIFIGVLLASFIGVGIAAFYPAPKSPDYTTTVKTPSATESAETLKDQDAFNKLQQTYERDMNIYNRNVSIMAIVAAIVLLIISLTFMRQVILIADGVLLGGVLTLLYGIGRGFGASDNMFRFVVVSIGLAVALGLGYLKFVRPEGDKV